MRIANWLTWPSRRRTSFGQDIALTLPGITVNLRNATQETYAAAEKKYGMTVSETPLLELQILINGGLH